MAYNSQFNTSRQPTAEEIRRWLELSEGDKDIAEFDRQNDLADKLLLEGLKPRQQAAGLGGAFGALGQGLSGYAGGLRTKQIGEQRKLSRDARLDARNAYANALFGKGGQGADYTTEPIYNRPRAPSDEIIPGMLSQEY